MPIRQVPRTVAERISTLRFVWTRLNADPLAEHPFMAATVARLMAFYPTYTELLGALRQSKAMQGGSTHEVKALRSAARIWVSHGYQSILNATVRGTFTRSELPGYGLPSTAKGGPRLSSDPAILTAAATLESGEEKRVAAGGQPLAFPSVAEIMEHVNAFEAAFQQQNTAKNTYGEARKAIAKANKEADKLILRLWNEIEAAFNSGDRPSMRRKARRWGVLYVKSRSEPPTEETNSVMGHITKGTTGKALRHVMVHVEASGIRTRTNANGRYALPLIEAGEHKVVFRLKGHTTEQRTIVVVDGEMQVVDVRMEEA